MKSQRQKISEDRELILGRHSEEYSQPIPIDLIIEILSRLPAKYIARCRCVSKLWASILVRTDFTDYYFTRSSTRPQLLFACVKESEVSIYTSPQPRNMDDNLWHINIIPNFHMKFPCHNIFDIYSPVSGLLCIIDNRILKGRKTPMKVTMICNLSTGESFTLPRITSSKRTEITSFFGYDPVEKQFKVLSSVLQQDGRKVSNPSTSKEHQVLTLKAGILSWRMVECGIPHHARGHNITINGVLYYTAADNSYTGLSMIICFDVRSEKFSSIRTNCPVQNLMNYNGKLCSITSNNYVYATTSAKTLEMRVLEDPVKHEWSKHIYILPILWKYLVAEQGLHFVGVTSSNKIVLAPIYTCSPFHVVYYNIEKETIKTVQIQGMEIFEGCRIYTFLDHVEDVKLMQAF